MPFRDKTTTEHFRNENKMLQKAEEWKKWHHVIRNTGVEHDNED